MSDQLDAVRHLVNAVKLLADSAKTTAKLTRDLIVRLDKATKRMESLEHRMDMAYSANREIGERRMKKCFHQHNGYCCYEEKAIADPSEMPERKILEKDGKFYPFVNWVSCYLCEDYTPSPNL